MGGVWGLGQEDAVAYFRILAHPRGHYSAAKGGGARMLEFWAALHSGMLDVTPPWAAVDQGYPIQTSDDDVVQAPVGMGAACGAVT